MRGRRILKKERPHPHSQQRRSRGGNLGKANWSTTTSYMLGGGGNGGLCNPIPALAPVLSSNSPAKVTPFPPRYPSFLLARPLSNIQPKQWGVLRWPIGPWLCREMSPAWGRQRAVSCAPPFAAATAGWQQPHHPSKTFITLLAS